MADKKSNEKTGELAKSKEELYAAGVDHVEDLGDGLVGIHGIKGEFIVVRNDGAAVTDPDQRQKATDISLERSRTQGNDIRHSDHEDFVAADGSTPNRSADASVSSDAKVEENPADASKNASRSENK